MIRRRRLFGALWGRSPGRGPLRPAQDGATPSRPSLGDHRAIRPPGSTSWSPPRPGSRRLAEGFDWSEGPVLDSPGRRPCLFSDVPQNVVYKWTEGLRQARCLPQAQRLHRLGPEGRGARVERPGARPEGEPRPSASTATRRVSRLGPDGEVRHARRPLRGQAPETARTKTGSTTSRRPRSTSPTRPYGPGRGKKRRPQEGAALQRGLPGSSPSGGAHPPDQGR